MNAPHPGLMRIYNTEPALLLKQAGIPLSARLAYGLHRYGTAKDALAQEEKHRAEEKELVDLLRARALMEMAQTNTNLRHSRPPVLLLAGQPADELGHGAFPLPPGLQGADVPVGLDTGMVRLAFVAAGAGADLALLEKDAGFGQMLSGIGRGVAGLGKGLAGGVGGLAANTAKGIAAVPGRMGGALASGARAATGGAQSTLGRIGQGMNNFGAKVEQTLTGAGQRAQTGLAGVGARAQSSLSGQPNMQAIMARPSGGPKPPSLTPLKLQDFTVTPPAISARTAAPGAPAAAPRPGAPAPKPPSVVDNGGASAPAPAPPAPQPSTPYRQAPPPTPPAQPAAPTAPKSPAPQPGFMDRMRSDLGSGQYKWKLPMLAAAGLGTYGAYRGLKAGLNYMSGEAHPYTFNAGSPQLAYGVNEYGQAQVGTPFQQ